MQLQADISLRKNLRLIGTYRRRRAMIEELEAVCPEQS
jgi:hypothetical protein